MGNDSDSRSEGHRGAAESVESQIDRIEKRPSCKTRWYADIARLTGRVIVNLPFEANRS